MTNSHNFLKVLLRGGRCLEIDVWDGEPHSSSSSSSDSEDGGDRSERKARKKEKKKSNRFNLSSLSQRLDRITGHDHNTEHKEHHESTATDTAAATAANVVTATATALRTEPRVLHGYTLTKEVTFRDVCYAIRDNAFVTSDLPVIVSLEVHTSLEQQEAMVNIMEEAWQGLLLEIPPEIEEKLENGEIIDLPSPSDLQRKILIKVKWAPSQKERVGSPEDEANDSIEVVEQPSKGIDRETGKEPENKSPETTTAAKPPKILHSLSRLGVYTRGYKFNHFSQPGKYTYMSLPGAQTLL